jgi:hypothetical protein
MFWVDTKEWGCGHTVACMWPHRPYIEVVHQVRAHIYLRANTQSHAGRGEENSSSAAKLCAWYRRWVGDNNCEGRNAEEATPDGGDGSPGRSGRVGVGVTDAGARKQNCRRNPDALLCIVGPAGEFPLPRGGGQVRAMCDPLIVWRRRVNWQWNGRKHSASAGG